MIPLSLEPHNPAPNTPSPLIWMSNPTHGEKEPHRGWSPNHHQEVFRWTLFAQSVGPAMVKIIDISPRLAL